MAADLSRTPPTPAKAGKAPLSVGIVPLPNFTLMSLSGFVEFLRLSADERDFGRQLYCAWALLGESLERPILASCGFPMLATELFGDPRAFDYIVVHGGILHGSEPVPAATIAYVQQAVSLGVPVIGLCTGQFLLARLGLLDGRRCAVHFSMAAELQQQYPAVLPVTDEPVVRDGFITCPGGLAAINLAMQLVTEHCGKVRSDKTLHYLMADRGFDQMQATRATENDMAASCSDQRVVNAVGLMRQRLFERGTLSRIAREVGVSERELSTLFALHVHQPPAAYWRQLRLKAAHWLVLNSTRSITQIAHECGFTDSSHLILWFKRAFQNTPSRLRALRRQVGSD